MEITVRVLLRDEGYGRLSKSLNFATTSVHVAGDTCPRWRITSLSWIVASLCSRSSVTFFKLVAVCSGCCGSIRMSVGSSAVGGTEVMYAAKTSGTDPSRPVSSKTGRGLAPTVPPNGNTARWISPGPMTRFSVLQCVNVFARVTPVLGPGLVDERPPVALLLVLANGLHRDLHGAG